MIKNNYIVISVVKELNGSTPVLDAVKKSIRGKYKGSKLGMIGTVYNMIVPFVKDKNKMKQLLLPYKNDVFLKCEIWIGIDGVSFPYTSLSELIENLDNIKNNFKHNDNI